MSETPLTERQESLLSHLESVYLLAQAVSPDAATATHLVEATYTQAFVTLPLSNAAQDEKRWLFRLLIQIHHEQTTFERLAREDDGDAERSSEALRDLRGRLARHVADRALLTVLITLPDEQRLILLLCDAEGFSCEDAGFVLTLDPETACRQLEAARTTLHEALRADVSEQERLLLDQGLPENWLRPTLRRLVEAQFDLPPSALHHAIVASTTYNTSATPETPPDVTLERTSETPTLQPSASIAEDGVSHQQSTPARQTTRPRLRRFVIVLFLITAIGTLGYLALRSIDREVETNLITLSVKQADNVRPSFKTSSPGQAEEYVWNQLKWRLTLPSIDQTTLSGVALREVAPGITVPVFLYQNADDDDERISLYVFSYALLDRYEDRIQLEPEILRQIQDDQRFDLHDLGERNVLVWRNRDDIYVAVTPGDPEGLRQRIVFPS